MNYTNDPFWAGEYEAEANRLESKYAMSNEQAMAAAANYREIQKLTHSRIDTFKVCRKRHWFAYEIGVRRTDDAKALRMGSAFHDAIESLANSGFEEACQKVWERYDRLPENYDQYEWDIERETVLRLVCGYDWRWGKSVQYVAKEHEFELPLVNPKTKAPAKLFNLAGKIDGIVNLEDGRLAVIEHKLLSEDLGTDSPLWKRLRIDHQISMYCNAARRLGYPIDAVLYDVARKPTIKPTAVPVLDSLGAKIVLDKNGERVRTEKGLWRQTSDTEKGYVLQTRPMTTDEWGDKLASDIAARPEFYFARNEIARLDQDLLEYEAELWEIQKAIRDAQRQNAWFRTCNHNTCAWCPYFDICSNGWGPNDSLPEGFVFVTDLHPELGRYDHEHSPSHTT